MTCCAHLKWLLSSIPLLDIWRIIDSLPLISIDQQFLLSLSPAGEASHQHLALQRRRALHPCTLRIGGATGVDVRLALMMRVHKSVDREVYAMWRQVISRINILERKNKQISARSLLAAAPVNLKLRSRRVSRVRKTHASRIDSRFWVWHDDTRELEPAWHQTVNSSTLMCWEKNSVRCWILGGSTDRKAGLEGL